MYVIKRHLMKKRRCMIKFKELISENYCTTNIALYAIKALDQTF